MVIYFTTHSTCFPTTMKILKNPQRGFEHHLFGCVRKWPIYSPRDVKFQMRKKTRKMLSATARGAEIRRRTQRGPFQRNLEIQRRHLGKHHRTSWKKSITSASLCSLWSSNVWWFVGTSNRDGVSRKPHGDLSQFRPMSQKSLGR